MDAELLDVLIEGLFGFRRGLLKQVADLDKAIEQLTTLKEVGGLMPVDQGGLRKAAEELEIERNKKPNPETCEHAFTADACIRCGIYYDEAEKMKKKDEDIE